MSILSLSYYDFLDVYHIKRGDVAVGIVRRPTLDTRHTFSTSKEEGLDSDELETVLNFVKALDGAGNE